MMSLPDDAFVALSGETRDFDVNVMRKLIPGTGARSGERGGKRASNARRKKEREREGERVYCILSVALLNVAEGFLTQTTRFSWLILTSTRSWSGSGCSFVSVGVP